jgi:hypothetical protein
LAPESVVVTRSEAVFKPKEYEIDVIPIQSLQRDLRETQKAVQACETVARVVLGKSLGSYSTVHLLRCVDQTELIKGDHPDLPSFY